MERIYKPKRNKYEEEEIIALTEEAPIDEPSYKIEAEIHEEAPIGNYAKPQIGEIFIDDVEQLYKVIDVFTNSCVVEPVINKACFACEIISFESMKIEGWRVVAKAV